MRVLVTGAGNPHGAAVVEAMLKEGWAVRVFGVDETAAARFHGVGTGTLTWFPGDVRVAGSIEPALSERQVVVHCACLDEPGRDRQAHAVKVERGTLYTRYGAEREQVDHFVHVTPAGRDRAWGALQDKAVQHAKGTRGTMQVSVVEATAPEETARKVVAALKGKPLLGKQPGRESDAVTA